MKLAFTLALLFTAPLASQAAMVQFLYQSTVQSSVPSENISAGDDLFITISLDNGGGIENGVWGTGDVETITYQVGTGLGAFSHTFDVSDSDFLWWEQEGQFSTDQNGSLLSVPSAWTGGMSNWSSYFFINGYNGILGVGPVDLSDSNVSANVTVGGWTATAVPEPSAALLGSLGALALLRRRRR